jgi:hypothetical protein
MRRMGEPFFAGIDLCAASKHHPIRVAPNPEVTVNPYDKRGTITLLNVLAIIVCQLPAHAGQLWTVQAVDAGGKIVCDAFAAGAAGRPLYEFRFRRTGTGLLLIISYDDQQKIEHGRATIYQDGASVGTFQADATKFGTRNALAISLAPQAVDFADLEKHRSLVVAAAGQRFEMGLLASDHMADGMVSCTNFRAMAR